MTQINGLVALFDRGLELAQRHARLSVAVSVAVATVVAVADYLTGDVFPLVVCYLPSVLIATWVSHVSVGVVLAMVCCTGWLVDDLIGLGDGQVTLNECWTAASYGFCFLINIGMLHRLQAAYAEERRHARTDGLTGLLNAKAFRERAEEEIARAGRTERPVTAAFIDCDNFKTVNDTLGHLEGDRLLTAIAEQMRQTVRTIDIPARMGGDEFAILLPETSETAARQVVERLREDLGLRMRQENWPVTFSIGVAVYATPPETVDALLQGADQLMYEVKAGQKDAILLKLVA